MSDDFSKHNHAQPSLFLANSYWSDPWGSRRLCRTDRCAGGRGFRATELAQSGLGTSGDKVILRLDEEGLHVSTPAQALARAQGFVKGLGLEGRNLAAELVAERRREADEEER